MKQIPTPPVDGYDAQDILELEAQGAYIPDRYKAYMDSCSGSNVIPQTRKAFESDIRRLEREESGSL